MRRPPGDPELVDDVASGFASVGVSVDRLGTLATPGLQAYCESTGVPRLTITASHNPPEYNGVKLVAADGVELPRDRLEAVEARLFDGFKDLLCRDRSPAVKLFVTLGADRH